MTFIYSMKQLLNSYSNKCSVKIKGLGTNASAHYTNSFLRVEVMSLPTLDRNLP